MVYKLYCSPLLKAKEIKALCEGFKKDEQLRTLIESAVKKR